MRRIVPAAGAALALVAVALVAGCGGGGGGGTTTTEGQNEDAARFPRTPSVNYGDPAPPIDARVRAAAKAAGCTVRGFPSENPPSEHVETTPSYKVSLPPLSGPHNPVWADWGVYDMPLPFKYQVHNLEHGGIIVHLGKDVPASARDDVVALWRKSPPFMLVTPETFPQFPPKAVVVTSWQRWMVCNPWAPKDIAAITVYRDVYRGTGPEGIGALNPPDTSGATDRPEPAIPDPGA